jgi:hypothetical protein
MCYRGADAHTSRRQAKTTPQPLNPEQHNYNGPVIPHTTKFHQSHQARPLTNFSTILEGTRAPTHAAVPPAIALRHFQCLVMHFFVSHNQRHSRLQKRPTDEGSCVDVSSWHGIRDGCFCKCGEQSAGLLTHPTILLEI